MNARSSPLFRAARRLGAFLALVAGLTLTTDTVRSQATADTQAGTPDLSTRGAGTASTDADRPRRISEHDIRHGYRVTSEHAVRHGYDVQTDRAVRNSLDYRTDNRIRRGYKVTSDHAIRHGYE